MYSKYRDSHTTYVPPSNDDDNEIYTCMSCKQPYSTGPANIHKRLFSQMSSVCKKYHKIDSFRYRPAHVQNCTRHHRYK